MTELKEENFLSNNIKYLAKYKEPIIQIIFAILIFIIGTMRRADVAQPIILSDEYGYWANSSYFLGQDWSSVTSRINYYSYGYSLLLIPIRLLQQNFDLHWGQMYEAAIILNGTLLMSAYLLSTKICKRYFDNENGLLRSIVCFVAFLYTSNIFYAHITFTETTILFLFWLFLYTLMKAIDTPNVINHFLLALVSVYLYTVHQRTIAVLITAVIIVIYQKILNNNKLYHVASFWFAMSISMLIHSAIKKGLQDYFYMGNAPKTFQELISHAITTKTFIAMAVAGITLIILLLFIEKKMYKTVLITFLISIIIAGVIFANYGDMIFSIDKNVDTRISTNDFSGQWVKLVNLFSLGGLVRIGVSITGKWFYMAATTGLIVCWGLKDVFKQFFWWCVENTQCMIAAVRKKEFNGKRIINDKIKDNIWIFGVFLAVAGTFMVCAIYKEGLFKNDDLVHGRYNEFLMGILIIYSFYSLCKDKHWVRTLIISVTLFILAGILCQHTLNELERTEFELCHSVMLGRVFWNYEVPVGKVKILSQYVIPLGVLFISIMKVMERRFYKYFRIRVVIALLVPAISWTYLAVQILENYTIPLNEKKTEAFSDFQKWIDILDYGDDTNIYYLEDTVYYRHAQNIQFMMPDKKVIMINSNAVPLDEDAFFIMGTEYAKSEQVLNEYEIVVQNLQLSLVINKNYKLMERWKN